MKTRSFVCLLAFLTFAASAQTSETSHPETGKIVNIALWPGTAPGSDGMTGPENYDISKNGGRLFWNVSHPMMTALYAAKPSGAAVLVIPGGGYKALFFDRAVSYARWFNTQGVDAFVLKHRLPDERHRAAFTVPLQDAQRGLRLIRSGVLAKAAGHTIDPARVGVIGLSAGGHLAAVLATYHDRKTYDPVDEHDAMSARPDFMILAYAVLPRPSEVEDDDLRPNTTRLYRSFPIGAKDTSAMPPAFIMHGDKDNDVPFEEAVHFADKLKGAGVPVELHIFAGTGHAFGVQGKGEERVWPELCAAWLQSRGIIPAN